MLLHISFPSVEKEEEVAPLTMSQLQARGDSMNKDREVGEEEEEDRGDKEVQKEDRRRSRNSQDPASTQQPLTRRGPRTLTGRSSSCRPDTLQSGAVLPGLLRSVIVSNNKLLSVKLNG